MNASLLRRPISGNNDSMEEPTLTMSQIPRRFVGLKAFNFSTEKKPSWEDPEASIGDFFAAWAEASAGTPKALLATCSFDWPRKSRHTWIVVASHHPENCIGVCT